MTTKLHNLFPTPVAHVSRLVDVESAKALMTTFGERAIARNSHHAGLAHSPILKPSENSAFAKIADMIAPHLTSFGAHLFGEELNWHVTGFWINKMANGSSQAMHVHANSFISGTLYLTDSHPSANILFQRPSTSAGFVFSNFNKESDVGPYNADRWQLPETGAGDLVLFPSWLMHGVPENPGEQRISLSFNAVPDRLDSWGYEIRFSSP